MRFCHHAARGIPFGTSTLLSQISPGSTLSAVNVSAIAAGLNVDVQIDPGRQHSDSISFPWPCLCLEGM
jgi:hypothetical protein